MRKIIGQKIVMVDPKDETATDFIKLSNPVYNIRPVESIFTPDGSVLYLASIEKEIIRKVNSIVGILSDTSDYPFLQTGTIWKIIKTLDNVTKSDKMIDKKNTYPSSEIPYSTEILKDK